MRTILTGIQPTGRLHLGNYFGAIRPFIREAQGNPSDTGILFVADLHALTAVPAPDIFRTNRWELLLDLMSFCDDAQTVFIQSEVPLVMQLSCLLSNVVSLGLLERNHTNKDKLAKNENRTAGIFCYPVLMAADILLYGATHVPVGKDQVQHLEIARDIAMRFNHIYGPVLTAPEPLISDTPLVPGLDGRKMSKSYGNTIGVFDDLDTIRKSVRSIKMATDALEAPDENPLVQLWDLFLPKNDIRQRVTTPGVRFGELKDELADIIYVYFAKERKQREVLASSAVTNRLYCDGRISHQRSKSYSMAASTLHKVKKAMGLED